MADTTAAQALSGTPAVRPTSHPKGLYILFATEMWERFSYYGMRALLVLYMVDDLGWQPSQSSAVYKWYTSLVYLTPIAGGFLADRYLGLRGSIVIGGLLMAAGHFLMAFPPLPAFYAALGLLVAGNGFFKPNISTLVGRMYPKDDPRRDAAFTIFYMGINLGAGIAPFVCGALHVFYGYHYGFAAAGVGMVIGLVTFLAGQKRVLSDIAAATGPRAAERRPAWVAAETTHREPRSDPDDASAGLGGLPGSLARALPFSLVALAVAIAGFELRALFLRHASPAEVLMPLAFAAVAGWMAKTLFGIRGRARDKSTVVFVLFFFTVLFWMAFEQAGNALNLWAEVHTDRTVLGREYPAEWFQSVNPAFILLFAPAFSALWVALGRRGREPSTPAKMLAGLVLMAVSFAAMMGGAWRENRTVTRISLADLPGSAALAEIDAGRLSYDAAQHELVARGVFPKYAMTAALRQVVPEDTQKRIEKAPLSTAQKDRRLAEAAPATYRAALEQLAAKSQTARVSGIWLLLSYLFATLGELCLSPVGLSMVTRLAPQRFASLFMGVWLLGSSVAQYAGGTVGEKWGIVPPLSYFGMFVATSCAGVALLFFLVRPLYALMHEPSKNGSGHGAVARSSHG